MISIVKIGGNILDDEKALDAFLDNFAAVHGPKILVHGGGKIATSVADGLGIETTMINGRRVTDERTLQVITMTYAGWINKSVVAKLQARGCVSLGMCGADCNLVKSQKRSPFPVDYGFVGDPIVDVINTAFLQQLFAAGISPVVAPVTHDGDGQLLNTNADTLAAALASALSKQEETQLIFCFEKKGVLRDLSDENSIIEKLEQTNIAMLSDTGRVHSGMMPKLSAGFLAKQNGVQRVVIGHADSLAELVSGTSPCTTLYA
jgi:acetylglutamate kinase